MKLSSIRIFMEKNHLLRKVSLFLKRIGIVKLIHDLSECIYRDENKSKAEKFSLYYSSHKSEFLKVMDCLEDDFSKRTYQSLIDYHTGKNRSTLKKYVCFPQYFPNNISGMDKLSENCVFLDGGAYVGDTIEAFFKFTKGKYKKIFAWEPDQEIICKLQKTTKKMDNIEIIKKGLWSNDGTLTFSARGTGTSSVTEEGDVKVEVSSIDRIHADEEITFIKMDIEGAEQEALKGAVNTIRKHKPILAICIYHSWEDLYKIPLWIKENFPDYKIYIRAHSDAGAEVVAYAVNNFKF